MNCGFSPSTCVPGESIQTILGNWKAAVGKQGLGMTVRFNNRIKDNEIGVEIFYPIKKCTEVLFGVC